MAAWDKISGFSFDSPTIIETMSRNFLEEFYADYPSFNYRPRESVNKQFIRLCKFKNWARDCDEQEEAYEKFRDALVQQFNLYYGTDENDLGLWQALCKRIGMSPPETLEAARNAVLMTHVNLCDLVESYGTDDIVTTFSSLDALRSYTIEENLYFPKENAYAGGLLKYLLREIHGSYHGDRKPRTGKEGPRGGRRSRSGRGSGSGRGRGRRN